MKVLFTVHQFFPEDRAGVEIVTLGLAKELKERGHEPYVFAAKRNTPEGEPGPGEIEDYEYEGIPVRRVGRPEEGFSRPYSLNYRNERMAERAKEYAREVGPDLVHLMHLQGLSASVVPAFKGLGVPVVYTAADFWTVCPVVDLRRHDGAMCEGPETPHCVRCIASRNPDPRLKDAAARVPNALAKGAVQLSRTPAARFSGPLRQIGAVAERPAYIRENMKHVDLVLAYTRLTRDLLSANGIGVGKTYVSHYGVDTSHIPDTRGGRPAPPPLRVGFVGTLAPHKGCDVLVRAFGKLPADLDATLSIHGDTGRYAEFVEELRGLAAGDERITFHGAFSREEAGNIFSGLHALVVPSRWYENAPGVIFEAFAAGVPVVATDLGGMSEFVRPEENGLLFSLEDAEELAQQLQRLAEEPGLLRQLEEGIGPVKTVGEYVDEVEALYDTLLETQARRRFS
jgi:glycosyltransferase involved in cell wall biosynthesis